MTGPLRDLESITVGELESLPAGMQRVIRRALLNRALERMAAKYERYLDGDYTMHGVRRAHEWGQ